MYVCNSTQLLLHVATMIYKSKKSKKWKGSLLLTPIALMHTPHLDSHKHPRTDGGVHVVVVVVAVLGASSTTNM